MKTGDGEFRLASLWFLYLCSQNWTKSKHWISYQTSHSWPNTESAIIL